MHTTTGATGSLYTRRLLLLCVATAVALAAMETGLRLLWPQPLTGTWLTPSGRGYNVNRRNTSVRHVHAGVTADYRFNSLGLRGAEPAAAGLRVLAVGDSVTFGWLLSERDTYVERVANRLAERFGPGRVHLLNGAVAGWGTADYAAFIEDSHDEIKPGAILVFVGGDDVRRTWASSVWQESGDRLVRANPDTRLDVRKLSRLPGYNFLIEHSHAAQLVRRTLVNASQRSTPAIGGPGSLEAIGSAWTNAAVARTRRLFQRLARWCTERSIALLVVSGPSAAIGSRNPGDPTQVFLAGAVPFFADTGVPFLATAAFPDDTFAIPGDGHPNARGAAMIADLVSPWLIEQIGALPAK